MDRFSIPVRTWFQEAFEAPTAAQTGAWESIATGQHTLVIAPTGSGKTLAAFLWALDRLTGEPGSGTRVLYISPLKALAVDVDRNLRTPLKGIANAAQRLGFFEPSVTTAIRTGDTPQDERRKMLKHPPDILITTPESVYLLLTSQARETLRSVETVIIDEIHAVAATKRGAHLAISLERLDALLAKPAQRIGLSATVRPKQEVARLLGGSQPVTIVDAAVPKRFDLTIEVTTDDMSSPGAGGDEPGSSIWPSMYPRITELIQQHRSTIVFVNSRRLAERVCQAINEEAISQGATGDIARAHHGSVSREQRSEIEEALKRGDLPAVVATSSLELGIDMGEVDLVIQVEAPPSVASGLQRIGRGGHHVNAVSKGVMIPKYRGDLVAAAVTSQRMLSGGIESLKIPRNPIDVLAQHIVAMVATDDWLADDLAALVRRAAPFRDLPDSAFEAVLDMLAGRYPSDAFAELRPRIVWDRITGQLTARPGALRLAVTSGGTIPDRGLFGVFMPGTANTRVGELDEEMVYESRPGETVILGASTWRIEEITHDRVIVTPAPGQPGKLPFWKGDGPGRPFELGSALGAFVRETAAKDRPKALADLRSGGLDERAATNLLQYLGDQLEATGVLSDDHTIVVERFIDELGDWRVCIHSPFGIPVHIPWAYAIQARLRERFGYDVQLMYADDGIVLRFPESDAPPGFAEVLFDPDEISERVTATVGTSAMFASRFRECAQRALLLPRRHPGKRNPLWAQRAKSAGLLVAAAQWEQFPILHETMRECLQDAFDLPALIGLMQDLRSRKVRLVEVETREPSPFASSLLFGYIGQFMYEGDTPLAERRAQALSLDRTLLAELLGEGELRELLDPDAMDELESELQRLTSDRQVTGAEGVADLLRMLGDLTAAEVAARCVIADAAIDWLSDLRAQRRAIAVRVGGEERWIAVEDASRYRDALGTALPPGLAEAFLEPVADPLGDLIARYARSHTAFAARQLATRLGFGEAVAEAALRALGPKVVHGAFSRHGREPQWCDAAVLQRLRRRTLAALRAEIEPVAPAALTRFLPAWQGIGAARLGSHAARLDATFATAERLAGVYVPASSLESLVMAQRVAAYEPSLLDELCATGEVVWAGRNALGPADGWITLMPAALAPLLLAEPASDAELSEVALRVRDALDQRGAAFFRQLASVHNSEREVVDALWDLVWAGWATNDTLAPLRALVGASRPKPTHGSRRRKTSTLRSMRPGAGGDRVGPPSAVGRWSLLPARAGSATERLHATTESMLDRYGILVRGAVASEAVPGGWSAVYQVCKAMEELGRVRRGYFLEGLGGAQFALPGAVDRVRAAASADPPPALVLAATDPANPYGAALKWPETSGHKPGRKAGALVVLAAGDLAIYVERGGKSLLTFTDDPAALQAAVDALALAVRDGLLGTLAVERSDGEQVDAAPLGAALRQAGFHVTPRGLRLRS